MTVYVNEFGLCNIVKQPQQNCKKITAINVKGKTYDIYQNVVSREYIAVIVY